MQAITPILSGFSGGGSGGMPSVSGSGILSLAQGIGVGTQIYGDLTATGAQADFLEAQDLQRRSVAESEATRFRIAAIQQAAGLRSQAAQEQIGAKVAEMAADRERIRGKQESNTIRERLLRQLAQNTAATSSSGVSVTSGSPLAEVEASTRAASEERSIVLADSRERARGQRLIRGARLLRAGSLSGSADTSLAASRFSQPVPPPSVAPAFVRSGGLLRTAQTIGDFLRSQMARG